MARHRRNDLQVDPTACGIEQRWAHRRIDSVNLARAERWKYVARRQFG
jgi:hypothetical protein